MEDCCISIRNFWEKCARGWKLTALTLVCSRTETASKCKLVLRHQMKKTKNKKIICEEYALMAEEGYFQNACELHYNEVNFA